MKHQFLHGWLLKDLSYLRSDTEEKKAMGIQVVPILKIVAKIMPFVAPIITSVKREKPKQMKIKKSISEQLIKIYGIWGEHPDYRVTDWGYEASGNNIRRGYWDWVASMVEQAEEDKEPKLLLND